jgi:hypothetical protein
MCSLRHPVVSQDGVVAHSHARDAVEVGPAVGRSAAGVEPLFGKILNIKPIYLAIDILMHIANRTVGVNREH